MIDIRAVLARPSSAFAALLAIALVLRLPPLLNYDGITSDGAIYGLQTLALLRGDLSPFLWGAGYQGILECVVAAPLFLVFGAHPLALMAVPLIGQGLMLFFTWSLARRLVSSPWLAMVCCLPIACGSLALNYVLVAIGRQWSATVGLASAWVLGRAEGSRRSDLSVGVGAFLAVFAVYVDLFAMVFVPSLAVLVLLEVLNREGPARRARLAHAIAGAAVGLAFLSVVRVLFPVEVPQTALAPGHIEANLSLLARTCLPVLLGLKVWIGTETRLPEEWHPPALWQAFLMLAAAASVVMVMLGIVATAAASGAQRRLGTVALVAMGSALAAFLLSAMPVDAFSARYLAPLVWFSPLLLAVVANRFGAVRTLLLLAPLVTSTTVAGWQSWGSWTEGPRPVSGAKRRLAEIAALEQALEARDVHAGLAQYWVSYRLTFLLGERTILVPVDPTQDRRGPMRAEALSAERIAYVVDAREPRLRAEPVEQFLRERSVAFERVDVGPYTAIVPKPSGSE